MSQFRQVWEHVDAPPEYIATEWIDETSRRCELWGTFSTGSWIAGVISGATWATITRGTIPWSGSFSMKFTFGSWRNIDGNEYIYYPNITLATNKWATFSCQMQFASYNPGYFRLTVTESSAATSFVYNSPLQDWDGTTWIRGSIVFYVSTYSSWWAYIFFPYGGTSSLIFVDEFSLTN